MPELPEMEAWRRRLNDPVSAFPVAKAGPAHIATLKTFDPPLGELVGRRFRGVERRGKRLLFPTQDGELVLLIHLMTSGRLKALAAGERAPKATSFECVEGRVEGLQRRDVGRPGRCDRGRRHGVVQLAPPRLHLRQLGHGRTVAR